MKFKRNSLEKRWVLYDVANSAFTLLISTIIPIYFNYLAGNAGVSDVDYLAYWGYATSAATILVAVLGPVLGGFQIFRTGKRVCFWEFCWWEPQDACFWALSLPGSGFCCCL